MTAIRGFESGFLANTAEAANDKPVKVVKTALDSLQDAIQLGETEKIFQELQALPSDDVERVLSQLKETHPEQGKKIDETTILWQLRQALLDSSSAKEALKIAALLSYSQIQEVLQQLPSQNSPSIDRKLTTIVDCLDKAELIEKLLAERNFRDLFDRVNCRTGTDALKIKIVINFIELRQHFLSSKERAVSVAFSSVVNTLLDDFNSLGSSGLLNSLELSRQLCFHASIIGFIEDGLEHTFIEAISGQPLTAAKERESFIFVKQLFEKITDPQMQKELQVKLLAVERLIGIVATLKEKDLPSFLNQLRYFTKNQKETLYYSIEKSVCSNYIKKNSRDFFQFTHVLAALQENNIEKASTRIAKFCAQTSEGETALHWLQQTYPEQTAFTDKWKEFNKAIRPALGTALEGISLNTVQALFAQLPHISTEEQAFILSSLFYKIVRMAPPLSQELFKAFPEIAAKINDWNEKTLKNYCQQKLSDNQILNLVFLLKTSSKELFQNVAKRFEQLQKIALGKAFENPGMSNLMLLQIACFIEINIKNVANVSSQVFKKSKTKLARSLQFNTTTKKVFILSDKKHSVLSGAGVYKKVLTSAGIALDDYQNTFATVRVFTKATLTTQERKNTLREAAIAAELSDKPGFMRLHSICDYTFRQRASSEDVLRVSLVYEASDGSLEKVTTGQTLLTFNEKLLVAKDIIHGLCAMSEKGYLHGDIKSNNLLFVQKDPTTQKARGAVADFGFTRKETAGKAPNAEGVENYRDGYYGTPSYTAPELLGVANFSGNHSKTDVFALGLTLGRFFGIGDVAWIQELKKINLSVNWKLSLLEQGRKGIEELLQKNVEDRITALSSKAHKSREEKSTLLICQMLRREPEKRISFAQAKEAIDEIVSLNEAG